MHDAEPFEWSARLSGAACSRWRSACCGRIHESCAALAETVRRCQIPGGNIHLNLRASTGVRGVCGDLDWWGANGHRLSAKEITMSLALRTDPARRAFSGDDARWEALVRRDHAADGAFFYSVQTTGVYCRPSCAARLARRENVRFHASCADAERAGFRPCKRCRPNEASLARAAGRGGGQGLPADRRGRGAADPRGARRAPPA